MRLPAGAGAVCAQGSDCYRRAGQQWAEGTTNLEAVITTLVGLVLGVITGFYFERRAAAATRQENRRLVAQLKDLRTTVLSLGGVERLNLPAVDHGLADNLYRRAMEVQGPAGQVRASDLVAFAVGEGHPASQAEQALAGLIGSGLLGESGNGWVHLA